ncbi:hypothetical protein [Chitinophaga skermanii]|nr:hypothetical protein [Chitinophaga skermanii]
MRKFPYLLLISLIPVLLVLAYLLNSVYQALDPNWRNNESLVYYVREVSISFTIFHLILFGLLISVYAFIINRLYEIKPVKFIKQYLAIVPSAFTFIVGGIVLTRAGINNSTLQFSGVLLGCYIVSIALIFLLPLRSGMKTSADSTKTEY